MLRHNSLRTIHRVAINSTTNLHAASAAVNNARPVPRVQLTGASTLPSSSIFSRSIGGPSSAGGDRNKGQRAKPPDAGEEGESGGEASLDAPDAAAQAAAKKAAREAKKAKEAASVAATKNSEREARREKKEAQKAASMRAEQKFKASVIEKEVPLMDTTGIKPGQNKFANVLELMREENFPADVVQDLEQIGDFATGSTREILSGRIANLVEKYGRKPYDTGSPEVQIAALTERLKGYDRHMVEHKGDINSRRGFLNIWHRRRKLLKYLRHTKYETYAYIMKELNLREADIDSVGLDRTSGTQAARIKKD